MFIESWDDFALRARQLYQADPVNTRYVIRYNHAKGNLTVKVTDNEKVRCCSCAPGALLDT